MTTFPDPKGPALFDHFDEARDWAAEHLHGHPAWRVRDLSEDGVFVAWVIDKAPGGPMVTWEEYNEVPA